MKDRSLPHILVLTQTALVFTSQQLGNRSLLKIYTNHIKRIYGDCIQVHTQAAQTQHV